MSAPEAFPCARLGLFDSGLGGLSVLRAVRRRQPNLPLAYVGDTARVPYGPRPASEIVAFNLEIAAFLQAQGATRLVVACNTSCALALSALRQGNPLPSHGLIGPGAALAVALPEASAPGGVGVVATEGTIRVGAYGQALRALRPQLRVRELACPTWVPLVEAGLAHSPRAVQAVAEALLPWRDDPPAVLVLGCTHYPFLADAIRTVLGTGVRLVDPAEAAADEALAAWGPVGPRLGPDRCFASGDPQAFAAAAQGLGLELGEVERMPLAESPALPC